MDPSEGNADSTRRRGTPAGVSGRAARVADWTSKSILTGIILVAGLGLGRQVLRWWADDPSAATPAGTSAALPSGLGETEVPHRLQFGSMPWSVIRQTVEGTAEEALGQLRHLASRETASAKVPQEPLSPTEGEFLARLGRQEPVAQVRGAWRLYAFESGMPMVVGVRNADHSGDTTTSGGRIVCWGFRVPCPDKSWTLYALVPRGDPVRQETTELAIPPNGQLILSLGWLGGGGMVVFRGDARAESWQAFYDRWFADQGWRAVEPWRRTPAGRAARFAPVNAARPEQIDVHLLVDGPDQTRGLLVITR